MSDTNEKEIIHRAASRLSSTVMSFIAEGMAGKSAIFRTEFGDFLSPKAVEQAVAEAERRKVKEIAERIEKMRPFPFSPCPSCGGELKLGSSKEMRFGCYNENCERVKANNYFYIDVGDSYSARESENMLIDRILDFLKDE